MSDDTCTTHPEELAGWICEGCKQRLCGECTARAATLYYCAHCDARAVQRVVPRTERSLSHWVIGAVAYPLKRGLPIVAIAAIVVGGLGYTLRAMGDDYAGWSIALRAIALAAFAVVVVDATARGEIGERGVVLRVLRALLATAIVWLPAAGYAYFLGAPTKHDWTIYLFGGLAWIYLPMALAVAVTDVPLAVAVDPFLVFELGWVLGRRYVKTLIATGALGALAVAVIHGTAGKLAHAITVPLIGDIAVVLPGLAMVAIALHAVGLVVHIHGDAIGFGPAALYRDPILPKAIASARRKDAAMLTTEALTKRSEAVNGGATPEERNEVKKITDFLKGENMARALQIYEARTDWSETAFDDRQLLALGKAAQRGKNYALAQRLFEEGVARGGRSASQLLIAQAQLLGDLMGEPDAARALYRKVLAGFPGSDAAKIAEQRLGGKLG